MLWSETKRKIRHGNPDNHTADRAVLRRHVAAGPDAVRLYKIDVSLKKEAKMNEIVLFLLLCALGALCYGFYFKCVDWFEKI